MTILSALLSITIYSAVIYAAILLFRLIFRKHLSPSMLYLVWMLLIARLLIPVTLDSGFSLVTIPPAQAADQPQILQPIPSSDSNTAEPVSYNNTGFEGVDLYQNSDDTVNVPFQSDDTVQDTETVQQPPFTLDMPTAFIGVWILGMALMLIHTLVTALRLRKRLLNDSVQISDVWLDIAKKVKADIKVRGNVNIVMIKNFVSPALNASLFPTIVMPEQMASMDDEKIEFAFRHEMTHLKRKDHLVCILLLVLRIIYWFNPVVWLAFKQIKADMETACDIAAVKPMSRDETKRYAITILEMYAKEKVMFALGMALGSTKKTAEKRVRGIFARKRSSYKAKITAAVLAAVMLLACFTTACQPVEGKAVVISGDGGTQQTAEAPPSEATNTTPVSTQSTTPEKEPLAKYKTVDRWTDSFTQDGSILKVNADADIIMPDVNYYSIYKVNHAGRIAQSEADKIISLLFGKTPVYKFVYPTKEGLQKQLDKLDGIYQTMQDGTYDFSQYSDKQNVIDNIKTDIKYLKKEIRTAPEAGAPIPLDTTLVPDNFGGGFIRGVADLGKDDQAEIIIDNGNDGTIVRFNNGGNFIGLYGAQDIDHYKAPIGNLTISEADAEKTANNFLAELGLNNYQLYSDYIADNKGVLYEQNTVKYAHIFVYSRVVDGVTVSPNNTIPLIKTMDYNPEYLAIAIDDSGIEGFDWEYKFDVDKTSAENVSLLPMNQIKDIISKQMFTVHAEEAKYIANGQNGIKADEYTYNIESIKLEYAKIPYGSDLKDCRLVPVWNVYATTEEHYSNDGGKTYEITKDSRSMVVLTINAIDGSVIDKSLQA